MFANRPSCYPARGGSYSGGNYWGNYISVRKVRLLSTTQNVIFGDFCFIRFTKMPLCFNLDCRIWSLLTLLSKEIPLIAKTSTYLITSFQMEKIRILVYFVLACTPVCWNSIIDNYYAYWLPIPCQSFVHKVSCNLYTSNDKWDNKGEFRAKMFSYIHTDAEIINPSLPNSKACAQMLLPYTGSKMRNILNNEIFKYVCFSLCIQDCAFRPLWVSEPCYPSSPFLGLNLYMVFTFSYS